jgi:hypothetical protein
MGNPVLNQAIIDRSAELDTLKPKYESAKAALRGPAAEHYIKRSIDILSAQIGTEAVALVQVGRLAEAVQPLLDAQNTVDDYEAKAHSLDALRKSPQFNP